MSMYSSSLGSEKVGCIAIVSNEYLIHHYFFKKTNNMSMHHYHIAVLKMDIEHVCFKFISSVNPKNITETGNSTIISTIYNIYISMSRRVRRYQRGKRNSNGHFALTKSKCREHNGQKKKRQKNKHVQYPS